MAATPDLYYRTGALLVIGSAVLFSIKAVFIKLAYRYHIDPVSLMTLRMLFSAPFYLLIALRSLAQQGSSHIDLRLWLAIFALGLSGYYCASILDLSGLQYITANFERMILYLYPSLVLIMSTLFFGRKLQLKEVVCLLFAYGGLALVFATELNIYASPPVTILPGIEISAISWGSLLVFGSAFTFAVYVVGSERVMRTVSPGMFTSLAMLVSTLAICLHFLSVHPLQRLLHWPVELYAIVLAIAVFATVLPSYMMAEGIKRVSATRASIFGTIGPVSTMAFGALWLGEIITPVHVLGLAIVVASSAVLSRIKQAN